MSKFFEALQQAERDRALRASPPAGVTSQPRAESPEQRERQPGAVTLLPTVTPETETDRGSSRSSVDGERVDEHLVSLLLPASFAAEQFRGLRHAVEQWRKATGQSVVAISSATGGDGKTLTAINLAGALAQASEARVMLIEADLRHPAVAHYLALDDGSDSEGLAELISLPDLTLEQVVRSCAPFNLSVLPAGRQSRTPYEVLKGRRFEEVMEEARQQSDYVVVDTPPFLAAPDCRVIAKVVDTFVLVVAANRTPRKLVEETLALIEPSQLLGIVFNGDDRDRRSYYPVSGRPTEWDRASRWRRLFR